MAICDSTQPHLNKSRPIGHTLAYYYFARSRHISLKTSPGLTQPCHISFSLVSSCRSRCPDLILSPQSTCIRPWPAGWWLLACWLGWLAALVGWLLAGWLAGCGLAGWLLAGCWLAAAGCWLAAGGLVAWLLAGWLVAWLAAGWLAGCWLVGCLALAAAWLGWLLAAGWLAGRRAGGLLAGCCWLAAGWLLAAAVGLVLHEQQNNS